MSKVALILLAFAIVGISGHGKMMKPPNRSSIWRVPEFANQNPPQNYGEPIMQILLLYKLHQLLMYL